MAQQDNLRGPMSASNAGFSPLDSYINWLVRDHKRTV
jgi:hypothetical protein